MAFNGTFTLPSSSPTGNKEKTKAEIFAAVEKNNAVLAQRQAARDEQLAIEAKEYADRVKTEWENNSQCIGTYTRTPEYTDFVDFKLYFNPRYASMLKEGAHVDIKDIRMTARGRNWGTQSVYSGVLKWWTTNEEIRWHDYDPIFSVKLDDSINNGKYKNKQESFNMKHFHIKIKDKFKYT
jgi:hypothetical protein